MARKNHIASVLNPSILGSQETTNSMNASSSEPYTFVESSMDAFIQNMRAKKSSSRIKTP